MRKQIICFVYRLVKGKKEFLLLFRIKGQFWQPVSGGAEKGETLLQACLRECKEEAGLSEDDIIIIYNNIWQYDVKKHYLTGEPIEQKEFVFAIEVNNSFEPDITKNIEKEHSEYKWVDESKVKEMLKWKENKEAFDVLVKYHFNKKLK